MQAYCKQTQIKMKRSLIVKIIATAIKTTKSNGMIGRQGGNFFAIA